MQSFRKQLSKVDSEKQMAVPVEFMDHLPHNSGGYTTYFPVMDVSGKVWNFGYYVRPPPKEANQMQKYHPKPVFQGDWHSFVRAKKLVEGDQIIFRMERDGTGVPNYTIAANKPKLKLLGKVIVWGSEF